MVRAFHHDVAEGVTAAAVLHRRDDPSRVAIDAGGSRVFEQAAES